MDELFRQQLLEWPLLAKGVSGLAAAATRAVVAAGAEVLVRHIPHRAASTTAAVDGASIRKRPCFLCAGNLDPRERGLPFGDELNVYGNPFPVVERHLTIVHREHRPQRIEGWIGAMLDLAAALPGFFVLYNGPECGASAPDHLHFQAGSAAGLPIVRAATGTTGPAFETHGVRSLLFRSAERSSVLEEASRAIEVLSSVTGKAPEPWINLVAFRAPDGSLTSIVFPRGKHRPDVFHTGALTVSPAAIDLCGILVAPRAEDFERITGDDVAAVFREVTLPEAPFREVVARLVESRHRATMRCEALSLPAPAPAPDPDPVPDPGPDSDRASDPPSDADFDSVLHASRSPQPGADESNAESSGAGAGGRAEAPGSGSERIGGRGDPVKSASSVSVGLIEALSAVEVELIGSFSDATGARVASGRHRFSSEVTLTPDDARADSFALDDVTIGIGFHWERRERQVFRGALRILPRECGLTAINDVALEEYVASVISSEMSATCPLELLKAHAVISRSWLKGPLPVVPSRDEAPLLEGASGAGRGAAGTPPMEIRRWYGREAHPDFEVCADDHCQRYQGITKAVSPAVADAVRATAGEMLLFDGAICDARFSKCCGGLTERYATCWDDREVPYLTSLRDGAPEASGDDLESFIRSSPPAFCNTRDAALLARILPGFDQETTDFYRWRVAYTPDELGELVRSRLNVDLGSVVALEPLARGPSGRISRLRIRGERGERVVGKELEIRRALSRSHLYSSAFVVDRDGDRFVLTGAGWGHGVGLCQIGAAVMADRGCSYREILLHYYPGTTVDLPA